MFVDEVGTGDRANLHDPNNRFLCLVGVIIEWEHLNRIVITDLRELKERYFKDLPHHRIILHRTELAKALYPFGSLKGNAVRDRFDVDLLSLLSSWEYELIGVCIDKKWHQEANAGWHGDPYHFCLEALVENYVFTLNKSHARGDIVAESRGKNEDKGLRANFKDLYRNGTHYIQSQRIKAAIISDNLIMEKKINNSAGLQVADLLAHPCRTEILLETGIKAMNPSPFALQIVKILRRKYVRWEGVPARKMI
jgi:hypothetical protein